MKNNLIGSVLLACVLGAGVACARFGSAPANIKADSDSSRFLARGVASIYSKALQGQRTASGETFDKDAFTAAHRELPFGTYVRVVNKENGKQVIVRVNDRGPFAQGRIIDLSPVAARKLGFTNNGIAPVELFLS